MNQTDQKQVSYTVLIIMSVILVSASCIKSGEAELPDDIAQLENVIIIEAGKQGMDTFHFEHEHTYADTENAPLGRIAGFAVDENDRVFIGDSDQHMIHVFGPGGEYIKQLGKSGEGPGEFRSLDANIISNSEFLFAYDPAQRRISIYSLADLEFNHTINLSLEQWGKIEKLQGAYPFEFFPMQNRSLVMAFVKNQEIDELNEQTRMIQQSRIFYQMDWDGHIRSDLLWEKRDAMRFTFRMGGMMVGFSYPFLGRIHLASDGRRIFFGDPEDLFIKMYDINGTYQRVLYHPLKRKGLKRDEAIYFSDEEVLQETARTISLPKAWPALNDLLIDDENHLWVSTIVEDFDIYEWWVLKDTGELITKFGWPRGKPIEVVKNGFIYTRETDEETGLQQVVRYRIEIEDVN